MNITLDLTESQVRLLEDSMHTDEIPLFIKKIVESALTEKSMQFVAFWEGVVSKDVELPYIKARLETGEIHDKFIQASFTSNHYKNYVDRLIQSLHEARDIIDLENKLDNMSETLKKDSGIQEAFVAKKEAIEQAKNDRELAEKKANEEAMAAARSEEAKNNKA